MRTKIFFLLTILLAVPSDCLAILSPHSHTDHPLIYSCFIPSDDITGQTEISLDLSAANPSSPADSTARKMPLRTDSLSKLEKLKDDAFQLIEKVIGMPDSIEMKKKDINNDWRIRFRNHTLSIWDTTVNWPAFPDFCLRVYRWVYDNFNRQDTTYINKGKYQGKIMLSSDNWFDTYRFRPGGDPLIMIQSSIYYSLGAKVKYGVISLGYSFDLNNLAKGKKNKHYKWSFGINFSRLSLEANIWRTTGPNYITAFGNYGKEEDLKVQFDFDGLKFSSWNLHALYIFDYKKFAMNAAYNYDNSQRITKGSFVTGLDIFGYNADFDFTKIPDVLQDYHHFPLDHYRFSFHTYTLCGGYSINWVMNKHFLFNVAVIPGLGVTKSKENSSHGADTLLALNFRMTGALLYTVNRFFVGINGLATGNFFLTKKVDFLNTISNFQLGAGFKF